MNMRMICRLSIKRFPCRTKGETMLIKKLYSNELLYKLNNCLKIMASKYLQKYPVPEGF